MLFVPANWCLTIRGHNRNHNNEQCHQCQRQNKQNKITPIPRHSKHFKGTIRLKKAKEKTIRWNVPGRVSGCACDLCTALQAKWQLDNANHICRTQCVCVSNLRFKSRAPTDRKVANVRIVARARRLCPYWSVESAQRAHFNYLIDSSLKQQQGSSIEMAGSTRRHCQQTNNSTIAHSRCWLAKSLQMERGGQSSTEPNLFDRRADQCANNWVEPNNLLDGSN